MILADSTVLNYPNSTQNTTISNNVMKIFSHSMIIASFGITQFAVESQVIEPNSNIQGSIIFDNKNEFPALFNGERKFENNNNFLVNDTGNGAYSVETLFLLNGTSMEANTLMNEGDMQLDAEFEFAHKAMLLEDIDVLAAKKSFKTLKMDKVVTKSTLIEPDIDDFSFLADFDIL